MEAEPAAQGTLQEAKNQSCSDVSAEAIQACYDLVSSGRSLSEILIALKRLGPLNKAPAELGGTLGDTQLLDPFADSQGTLPHWAIAQVATRLEASLSLVPLNREPSQQHARDEWCRKPWWRPIGAAIFWLIPAMSLMLIGIAGKRLTEADLVWSYEVAHAGVKTRAPAPAITVVGPTADQIAPEQVEPGRGSEPDVTAAPAEPGTQAVTTAPPSIQDGGARGTGRAMQGRSWARSSIPRTGRSSLAQRFQSEVYGSSPREWTIPRRLTDGF
jgi:hypothetical protein